MNILKIDTVKRKFIGTVAFVITGVLLLTTIWITSTRYTVNAQSSSSPRVSIQFFNGQNQEIGPWRPFPLDRVARGERFEVKVTSTIYPITIQAIADNGTLNFTQIESKPFSFKGIVPSNPNFDNATVRVFYRGVKVAERRLPIGRK